MYHFKSSNTVQHIRNLAHGPDQCGLTDIRSLQSEILPVNLRSPRHNATRHSRMDASPPKGGGRADRSCLGRMMRRDAVLTICKVRAPWRVESLFAGRTAYQHLFSEDLPEFVCCRDI